MNYTRLNGKLVTLWMAWQIMRMDAAFFAVFGLHLIVADAIRTDAEQEAIFRARYVTVGNVRGRRVYDTRWWNGQLWYRISSAGTVAVPGTSNHQIRGTNAAVDFWDTGSDAGVSRAGSARANWLRANAWRWDFEPEGYGFNEAWHYKALRINQMPPSAPTPNVPLPTLQEDQMIIIRVNVGKDTHICALGIGHFAHLIQKDNPAVAQDITGQDKDYTFDIGHLPNLLRYYGCDPHIWDVRNGAFVVLDPLDGSVKSGNAWTAEKVIRSEQAALRSEQAKLVKRLEEAGVIPKPKLAAAPAALAE